MSVKSRSGRELKEKIENFFIRLTKRFIILLFVLGGIWLLSTLIEKNDAGFYQVRRHLITGKLYVRYEPGFYFNGLCSVTTYQRQTSYTFSNSTSERNTVGPAIKVRFNDGGEGFISGDFRFQLPANDEDMVRIHEIFGSPENIMKELFAPLINEVVYKSSQLLSSEESYTNKARFAQLTVDQLENGIYLTEEYYERTNDPISGAAEVRRRVRIKRDANGAPVRIGGVPGLKEYNITITQNVIREPDYGGNITSLIEQKRRFENDIAVAEANAEKANQEKLTVIANGRKNVTVAEYEAKKTMEKAVEAAKKDKIVAITDARRELEVAKQNYRASKARADGLILETKGVADRRKKVKEADNALLARAEAFNEIMGYYSRAYSAIDWSPRVATAAALQKNSDLPPAYLSLIKISEIVRKDLNLDLNF